MKYTFLKTYFESLKNVKFVYYFDWQQYVYSACMQATQSLYKLAVFLAH
jgi:hypothetical protein